MINRKFFGNIKFIVLIGYSILFILTIFGVAQIYSELVKLSNQQNPYENRKELTLISNALVSMYEAEGVRKVMLSAEFDSATINKQYMQLNKKVLLYIDSLYMSTDDKLLQTKIDTIKVLLTEKDINFKSMIILLDSIKNLPYSQKILTTVLSRKDISNLNNLVKQRTESLSDTSYLKKEKKGFFARVKQVFVAQADSTQIISKQNKQIKDSAFLAPTNLLSDTVIQYINAVSKKNDKKKIMYLAGIHLRQNEMLYYDELLTNQINSILLRLDIQQRGMARKMLLLKENTIKNSFNFMSIIALAALFTLIVFIIYTLFLINRSQKYRKQLEISKKHAEDLMNSRERLLLMISHDIKSPLSSIFGHIDLLDNDKMCENEKKYIHNLRNSSEHILDLVNKLLDYHKLEQGRSVINEVSFSPYSLMEDIYHSFIPVCKTKGLQLISENNIQHDKTFDCDPFAIKQIVNNLITNAVKFTPTGSVSIQSAIHNNDLTIKIKDTGVGIIDEDKHKIFEEFRRVGTTQAQKEIEGYGLGLAITFKLVQLLEGKINFDSSYGEGSEFDVSIPLLESKKTKHKMNYLSTDQKTKIKTNKVLYIDDDIVLLNIFKKLLEREGSEVTTCLESAKVMELIQSVKFDIIFTDIQMPQINGFELVKQIRSFGIKHYEEIPIIALSGRYDLSKEAFQSAGFTTFLAKPIPFNVLDQTIKTYVNNIDIEEIRVEKVSKPRSSFSGIIEFFDDDIDAALEILTVLLSENKIKLDEFNTALTKKDWASIKSTAHKLLPLMIMIEANDIVSILNSIEEGSKDKKQVEQLIELIVLKNLEVQDFIDTQTSQDTTLYHI